MKTLYTVVLCNEKYNASYQFGRGSSPFRSSTEGGVGANGSIRSAWSMAQSAHLPRELPSSSFSPWTVLNLTNAITYSRICFACIQFLAASSSRRTRTSSASISPFSNKSYCWRFWRKTSSARNSSSARRCSSASRLSA